MVPMESEQEEKLSGLIEDLVSFVETKPLLYKCKHKLVEPEDQITNDLKRSLGSSGQSKGMKTPVSFIESSSTISQRKGSLGLWLTDNGL